MYPDPERVLGIYFVNATSIVADQIIDENDRDAVTTITLPVSGTGTLLGAFKNIQNTSVADSIFWIERQI